MVRKISGIAIAALILVCCSGCGRSRKTDSNVLAVAGGRTITEQEFMRRVELSPLPAGIDLRYPEGREKALELIIGEKLFAQEAEKQGLENLPVLRKKLRSIERAAVGRELYREVVQNEVRVEEEEIRDAYRKMNETLEVRFLQTRESGIAKQWKKSLDEGMSFDELLESLHGGPVSGKIQKAEVIWGKSEPAIEEAAYALNVEEISPVIRVSNGYLILKLENRIQSVSPSEISFASRRRTVEKILRRRKEAIRSGLFVQEFMRDKRVVLKGRPFSIMAGELQSRVEFGNTSDDAFQPKIKLFIEEEVSLVQTSLTGILDDVLVEFRGGSWTVRDFLKKLWMDEVPITRRSPPVFHSGLQEAIRIMVRDELLAEEGYSQGLDSRPSVRNEVAVWRDNFLYVSLKNRLIKENISPKEYLASLRGSAAIEIDHGRLRALDLTLIPMIAVRSDFQRRLVVPLWPAFQDFLRKNSQSGR